MIKKCNKCLVEKDHTEFFRDKIFKDGYMSTCKVCKQAATMRWRANKREEYNAYMREFRHKDPKVVARDRNKALRLRYGITTDQFNAKLASQDGKCAICKEEYKPGSRAFHTDHSHGSGKVRGILCASCNRSIAIYDDPFLKEAAELYLKQYV